MNELKDYQSVLAEKAGRVESFFAKYPDDSAELGKTFAEICATKISKVEPEIMVYGIYNAGKSSILNELIGEDKAEVEDKPTTDAVTYYDWQGYKIADTPGIFAPIEHEEVTQEHLKKADIVLFVMSTTGSNEKEENYRRMKEIADAGKKIIIVLNDKNGDLGRRDENIQEIKRKVAVNMKQVGIEDVDEKYCIVTVNAARAHKGRTENKSGLVEKSGLGELKNVILNELKRTTSFEILRGGIKQLENILDEFIGKLEAKENSELLRKMNQVLETFNKQKISMRREINTYIDTKAEIFGEMLPQIIWSNRDKQNQLNEIMGEEVAKLNAKVQAEIQRQLQETAAILELELKSFAEIKIESSSVDAESFKNILARLNDVNTQQTQELVVKKDDDAKLDPSTIGIAAGLLTESGTAIAAQLAKTGIGKAIAETAVGRVLGSVVPIIGPIITIAGVIGALGKFLGNNSDKEQLDAKLAAQNEAERRRVEAEMQARQELNQKCRYLADNLADELKTAADNSVKEILASYEEPFRTEIEVRKAESAQAANDILKLRELHDEYDLLRVELGAR
ncbi:MAG: 50S ribosome-binding GTPase [Selenomonadaceae bacterium]|nr:50S ribosome-binding GTPase [Selenomonadaceae bacterium]